MPELRRRRALTEPSLGGKGGGCPLVEKQPRHLHRIQLNLVLASWHRPATSAGDHPSGRAGQGREGEEEGPSPHRARALAAHGGWPRCTLSAPAPIRCWPTDHGPTARASVTGVRHRLPLPTWLTSIQAPNKRSTEKLLLNGYC